MSTDRSNKYATDSSPNDPPSYNEAVGAFNILKQLQDAKQKADGNPAEIAKSACSIVCGSAISAVCMVIASIIPIVSIIIGAIYLQSCLIEPKIPIWLIVSGVFGCVNALFKGIINLINVCRKKSENVEPSKVSRALDSINGCIACFLFAWFIAVWVYSNHKLVQHVNTTASNYCDYNCYYFAFGVITASWCVVALGLCCFVGLIVFLCCGCAMFACCNSA